MSQASSDKSRGADKPSEDNRRGTERVPAQFSVMYSGMSNGGIGILGDHLVTHGMDLSLFINLPGIEEPMCVAESRVSWVSGRRFGIEMLAAKLDVQNELQFYVWNHLYR